VSARPRSVALLQLRAHDRGDFSERWPTILGRVAAAADAGAELIVLPEGTVPGYVIGSERVDPLLCESAARDIIAIAAGSGATIVYGGGRHAGDDFFNSAYVVTVFLVKPDVMPGWTTLSLLLSAMFLTMSVVLGMLSEYLIHALDPAARRGRYEICEELTSGVQPRDQRLNVEVEV